MDARLSCLIMLAVPSALAAVIYLLVRRARMKRALIETCLFCDSDQVDLRGGQAAYRCLRCGFDTDLEVAPQTRRKVDQVRDLKHALHEFEAGRTALKWAQAASVADLAGGRSGAKYQKMDDATRHMMEGFRLTRDVMTDHPSLRDMPIPGENLTISDMLADYLMDGVVANAIMIGKIAESRHQVDAFVDHLHAVSHAMRDELLRPETLEQARAAAAAMPRRERARALQTFADDLDPDAVDPTLRTHPVVQNRLLLPVTIGLVLCLIAGAVAWWALDRSSRQLDKVLIAIEIPFEERGDGVWWGTGGIASAALTDSLAGSLAALGFDTVNAGDPEVLAVMEGAHSDDDLLERARALDASHIIVGRLAPASHRELGGGVGQELALEGDLRVLATDAPEHHPDPIHVRRVGAGATLEEAARFVASDIGTREVAPIAEALLAHPDLQTLFTRDGRTRDEVVLNDKLRKARAFVATWHTLITDRDELLRRDAQAWATAHNDPDAVELSTPDHEEYLFGALPGDGGALVTVDERRPVYLLRADRLRFESFHERIERVSLDGHTRELLAETYNIYSYPSVSRDGRRLAFIVDEYGFARTLHILDLDKPARGLDATRVLLRATDGRYLSSPTLSPDGKHLFVFERDCARCDNRLAVLSTDGDGADKRVLLDTETSSFSDVQWLGDDALFLQLQDYGDRPRLALFPLDADVPQILYPPEDDLTAEDAEPTAPPPEDNLPAPLIDPVVSPDGRLVAMASTHDGAPCLALLDLDTGALTTWLPDTRVHKFAFHHSRRRIALQVQASAENDPREGDPEIGVFDLDTHTLSIVTRNNVRDRYPTWQPDGDALIFETEHPDPQISTPIMTVRALLHP